MEGSGTEGQTFGPREKHSLLGCCILASIWLYFRGAPLKFIPLLCVSNGQFKAKNEYFVQ